MAAAQVAEQILDRVVAGWRTSGKPSAYNRWSVHSEAAIRAKTQLLMDAELKENLGDNAPDLNAAKLHPWVWEAARSLWQSKHYRQAVSAAAIKLNAETQNKVNRRDVSEMNLFNSVFSLDPPKPGQPRLRVSLDDGGDTYKSVHRGVRAFAEGCYAAIRNPAARTVLDELEEHVALEQLATFSVLARWIDDSTVEST